MIVIMMMLNNYSRAKKLFDSESMKNKCNKNIGNCYFNKGNNLYTNQN